MLMLKNRARRGGVSFGIFVCFRLFGGVRLRCGFWRLRWMIFGGVELSVCVLGLELIERIVSGF